jgi:hypothetical protein
MSHPLVRGTILFFIGCTLLEALALDAQADPTVSCHVPTDADAVRIPDGLPGPITGWFLQKFGEEPALPGQYFNTSDFVREGRPAKRSRLDFAWRSGNKWLLSMEVGGASNLHRIYLIDASKNGPGAKLIAEKRPLPEAVCNSAMALWR